MSSEGGWPGRGVGQLLRVGVDREADRGRHVLARDVTAHPPQQLCGGLVVVGVRAEGVAQLTHQDGGRKAAPGDVADGDVHDAVAAAHDVVPVSSDLHAGAARLIATDELHALDLGQILRQQAALEADGDGVLVLEAARAVERERRLLRVPRDLGALRRVERALAGEDEAERADGSRRPGAQRRAVHCPHGVAYPRMEIRQLVAQGIRPLDREGHARRVGERGRGDQLAHERTRRAFAIARGELQAEAVVGFERDDGEGVRKGDREAAGEARGDLGRVRRRSEGMRELVALARPGALPLGLAARAHEQPADHAEHGRSDGGDQRELEHEPAAGGGEDGRARAIDDDRPAGHGRAGEGDDVVAAAVEPRDAREEARLLAAQTARERRVRRPREAVEELAPAAVEHRVAAEPVTERIAAEAERRDRERSREHSRDAAVRVVRRHRHHDDPRVRGTPGHAGADVGLAGRS